MEESRFFKNIWRFNGVVIALACLAAILGSIVSVIFIGIELTRDRRSHDVVNIDPDTDIEETFRLGRIQHIEGAQAIMVPLYSDQQFDIGYSSGKSTASTRNIMFADMHNKTNQWLLPTNSYLISDYDLVSNQTSYTEKSIVTSILFRVIKSDTNGDARLTDSDEVTLAFSTPEGKNYSEVLEGIDEVLGYDLLNEQAIAIMYRKQNQIFTGFIDLSNFTLEEELQLPALP